MLGAVSLSEPITLAKVWERWKQVKRERLRKSKDFIVVTGPPGEHSTPCTATRGAPESRQEVGAGPVGESVYCGFQGKECARQGNQAEDWLAMFGISAP